MLQIWGPQLSENQIWDFAQAHSKDTVMSVIRLQYWFFKYSSPKLRDNLRLKKKKNRSSFENCREVTKISKPCKIQQQAKLPPSKATFKTFCIFKGLVGFAHVGHLPKGLQWVGNGSTQESRKDKHQEHTRTRQGPCSQVQPVNLGSWHYRCLPVALLLRVAVLNRQTDTGQWARTKHCSDAHYIKAQGWVTGHHLRD